MKILIALFLAVAFISTLVLWQSLDKPRSFLEARVECPSQAYLEELGFFARINPDKPLYLFMSVRGPDSPMPVLVSKRAVYSCEDETLDISLNAENAQVMIPGGVFPEEMKNLSLKIKLTQAESAMAAALLEGHHTFRGDELAQIKLSTPGDE